MVFKNELSTKINLDNGIIKSLKLDDYKNILVLTGPKNSLEVFNENIKPSITTSFHIYSKITTNPEENDVYNIVNFARDKNIDLILSVGGGAVMDCGRMVSLLLSHGGLLHEYVEGGTIGTMGITPTLIKHITIPTISGSGAEIASKAVFKRADKFFTINSPFLCPDETYVDPTLMVGVPKRLWSNLIFHGFTMALEAYVSTYATYVSDMFAKDALEAYISTIKPLLSDTTNLDNIKKIVVASLNALVAKNMSSGGALSAIANSLGAQLNLHHGTALALLLPQVSQQNYESNTSKYDKVLQMLNAKKSTTINKALQDFLSDCGVWLPSIKARLNDDMVNLIATNSINSTMFGNPKEYNKQDVIKVLKSLK